MKKVIKNLRLIVPSQKARSGPPLSATLGQHGINIMTFCKEFNEKSKIFPEGVDLNVKILVYQDNSHDILIKNVAILPLIKKLLEFGPITLTAYYYLILLMSKMDFSDLTLRSKINTLSGTLRSFRINTYKKN